MNLIAKSQLLASFLATTFPVIPAAGGDVLEQGFSTPPSSAKPHTWWHWVDGNVSKNGITKDLEAMARIGLGGFQMFHVGGYGPKGPADYMSKDWRELVHFSVTEAERLNLEVTLHNCAGWANSGGPWVTPENAMKTTVWTETAVKGGRTIALKLPQPMTRHDYYHDIAVLAVREAPAGGNALIHLKPRITAPGKNFDPARLIDGDWGTTPKGNHGYLQVEFDQPFTAQSIGFVFGGLVSSKASILLESSNDGKTFTSHGRVYDAHLSRHSGSANFEPVTARYFRIVPKGLTTDGISELALSASPRVEAFGARAGYSRAEKVCPPMSAPDSNASFIRTGDVIDVTQHLSGDSTLNWDAPAGDWMLVRIGYTVTGKENRPAPPEGQGLECDKFNRPALKQHFDGMTAKVIEDAGPLAGKTLVAGLIDSFEAGSQNWTQKMPDDFRERAGYDIGPYLLTLTGRIVNSPGETDRFLNDFRRVIAGLFSDNYFGYFDELCAEHGLISYSEGYGDGNFEFLTASQHADIPMTEFWFDRGDRSFRNEWIKTVTSVAHGYGKPVVGAESFTSDPNATRAWGEHPGAVKRYGDLAYSFGINRLILHTFTHQPWPDHVVPGMTMGKWGGHFDRTETWWEMGTGWVDYMTRCQYLLQQGNYVADVAVYTGEDRPGNYYPPELPEGVNYDYISDELLLDQASAENGRLIIPSGASYRVLVLPDDSRMSSNVASKLAELAQAGVAITGPRRPDQVWGLLDRKSDLDTVVNDFWAMVHPDVPAALASAEIKPDFAAAADSGDLCFIHMRQDGTDVYFVANQTDRRIAPDCRFRITGKQPERWDPMNGKVTEPALFSSDDSHTLLPLALEPYESTFIVFRKTGTPSVAEVTLNGTPLPSLPEGSQAFPSLERNEGNLNLTTPNGGHYSIKFRNGTTASVALPPIPQPFPINGPWTVAFDTRWKAPEATEFKTLQSWSEHENDAIRHYSGTATYTKDFRFDRDLPQAERLYLDLGNVHEMAQVRLNGTDLGILWIKPFRIDITGAIKRGDNQLEIDVVNLWPNRLIGDERFPDDRGKDWKQEPVWFDDFAKTGQRPSSERMTYANWKQFGKDDPLSPSGLLGPVTIHTTAVRTIPLPDSN